MNTSKILLFVSLIAVNKTIGQVEKDVFSKVDQSDSSTTNETTVATSVDGQIILVYKADKENGNLYYSHLNGNHWTTLEKLSNNINTLGDETDEFISADGNTAYFSSDRMQGFGGKDIYKCKKLMNGKWDKPVNLGPTINTAFDEKDPFIFPDEHTLYFNSNRFKNRKQFDIYTSMLSGSETWMPPTSVGYPVSNTNDNNNYYLASAGYRNTVVSALKEKTYVERNTYLITFFDTKHRPITLIKGSVVDIAGEALKDPEIKVTDNETEDILGIYRPDNRTGKYMFILPFEKNINITYSAAGYLFYSSNIRISAEDNYYQKDSAVYLRPIEINGRIILNNIFFEADQVSLSKASNTELDNLLLLLTKNPQLVIEIKAYTNVKNKKKSTESFRRRETLNKERPLEVVSYLVEKGIDEKRFIIKGHRKYNRIKLNKNIAKSEQQEKEEN
jgi:outer membrane protein OmpA-like peptidoglycan-associated protein